MQRLPRWAVVTAFALGTPVAAWLLTPAGPRLRAAQSPDPEAVAAAPVVPRSESSPAPPRVLVVERCRLQLRDGLELASEQTAVVDRVVKAGQRVQAGTVVGQLRDQVLRRAFAIAEREAANDIEVRYSRKKADLDQLKYERALKANQGELGHIVNDLDLRELRLAAEQSLLQLEQAEHQLELNRLRRDEQAELLQTYQVVAPLDGVVTKIHALPGEVVREGEPLVEIANTDTLLLHGEVPVERRHLLRTGLEAVFTVGVTGPDGRRRLRDFPARITTVGVKVEPLSGKLDFTAEVENSEDLLLDGLVGRLVVGGTSPDTPAAGLGDLFRIDTPAASRNHSASPRLGN